MKPTFKSPVRIAALGAAFLCCGVSLKATTVAFLVLPEFANVLTNSPAIGSANQSFALYSGTCGKYSPPGSGLAAFIPTNAAGLQLASCGFGQMLARGVPFADFEMETIRIAQTNLYPPVTATTWDLIAGSGAAFRYKELLYTNDGSNVRAAFEGIEHFFGDAERQKARDGIAILRQALKYSPLNKKLRNALLDAYYDFIVAEAQYVKTDLAEVAKYRLGLATIPAGDFIIDQEIARYTDILNKYGVILDEYGKLLMDRGGIDVSQLDPTATRGIVLGQWIFQQEQPSRNQMAAQFRDEFGNLTTVPLSAGSMLPPWMFSVYQLFDLPSFASKLKQPKPEDHLSPYLSNRLSVATSNLLSSYSSGPNRDLQQALVNDLNTISCGPSIYDVARFSGVELSPETQTLLNSNPQSGTNLYTLNRSLLEDAYPMELSRNSQLFAGYKDYVALLGVMRDYAQCAAELAKLYGMRSRGATQPGQKDDKTLGFELIEGINRELLLNTSLLNALLPNAVPPASELDASGVRAALAGVLTSTAELTKVGSFLNSRVNVLGFDPDFLALISTFEDQNHAQLWDSYDALRGWLGESDDPSSIIGRARAAYDAANDSYDNYRGRADQVFNELSANESSFAQRYREICGYTPDEPADPYPTDPDVLMDRYPPVYANVPPTHSNNPRHGSELRQVHQSIEQSDAKSIELTNAKVLLDEQFALALDRLKSSNSRSDQIINATKTYKDKIWTEGNTITRWNAEQAVAQVGYDTVSDVASQLAAAEFCPTWGWGSAAVTTIAGAANGIIQWDGEQAKGDAERNLNLAAADFDKDLALADTDQNIFQAGEEARNIEREKQSQVLTMQDNRFVRGQDMERMTGLQREMQQAQVSRDQNNSDLAGRYYADPIHFLRAQNSMIRADFAFQSAQRWVFLLLRALEYKYNQPFVYTEPIPGSPRWELASLFKLRNALELDELLIAMKQFNTANLGKLNGRITATEKISLKNDVWGRTITGSSARLAEFRRQITDGYDANRGAYVIKLNTLRLSEELENGALFSGPEYGTDGSLILKGCYLDKIEYIKVKFVDSRDSTPVTKQGDLFYGGTCFVRPEKPQCTGGSTESTNELRSFPFRYFSMGTDPTTGALKAESSAEQSADAEFVFWNQPDKTIEPTDALNPLAYQSTFLRERSVAITELKLTLPASSVNINTLQDVHIYIRHLRALRTVCQQ